MGEGRAGAPSLEGAGLGDHTSPRAVLLEAKHSDGLALSPNPLTFPRHFDDLAPALRLPLPPRQQSSEAHRGLESTLTA